MKQQRGFTLIELIIVIVILGILAVTAAPKFIDIQGDATASTLQGVKAALKGGAQLVFAKSAIASEQNNTNAGDGATTRTDDVEVNGQRVETELGYPDADSMDATMVASWVDMDFTNDWDFDTSVAADEAFIVTPSGTAPQAAAADANTKCQILYTNAPANGTPAIVAEIEGC